ncbi:hypothetical protein BCR34DRAFT_283363 [Clohesyomyces aquaticus]|uniref:Secreted protein n=1 Tax=Clohesyomyces aquaticus TaxID=1231657 RepID=A0A1Y1Y106_9PLEO|nr:hypothetical protein BCR34DRAFT_283363 [Clohesyomyces aquaticus]
MSMRRSFTHTLLHCLLLSAPSYSPNDEKVRPIRGRLCALCYGRAGKVCSGLACFNFPMEWRHTRRKSRQASERQATVVSAVFDVR